MDIREYTLPEYVASYAMYGESCGDEELEKAYDKWLTDTMAYEGFKEMHLLEVKEMGFMRYHELEDIGSCDTGIFIFDCVTTTPKKD